jgi:hypothetical protein
MAYAPRLCLASAALLAVLATSACTGADGDTAQPGREAGGSSARSTSPGSGTTTGGTATTAPASAAAPRCPAASATPGPRAGPAPAPALEWGPPQQVSPYRSREDAPEGQIRVTKTSMLAAWTQPRLRGRAVITSTYSKGKWGPPITLGPASSDGPDGTALLLASTLTPKGMAAVVWQARIDGHEVLAVSDRSDECWSAPHPLATGGTDATVAIGPQGWLTVAWKTRTLRRTVINAASRSPTGTWEDTTRWSDRGLSDDARPTLAVDRRGDILLGWPSLNGVSLTTRDPDGPWSQPTQLVTRGQDIGLLSVAIASPRSMLAAWSPTASLEGGPPIKPFLSWSQTSADGTWTPVRQLTDDRRHFPMGDLALSMNRHGHALATWGEEQASFVVPEVRRSARFNFRDGWTSVSAIPGATGSLFPHLTDSDDALSVTYDQPGSYYQQDGQPWQRVARAPATRAVDASGSGQRMVQLYYGPSLMSRIFRMPRG